MTVSDPLQTSSRAEDGRRARILEAAERLVLAYGYHRVTMDDLARAAGISRPTLYLSFRNKADIYRAISSLVLDQSAATAERILAGPGPVEALLIQAMDEAAFSLLRRFLATPHGAEILDLKNELAGDLHGQWRERIIRAIAGLIRRQAGDGTARHELTPEGVATVFMAALEGLKLHGDDQATMHEAFRQLVRMTALSIGVAGR